MIWLLIACVEPDDNRFPTGGDPWTLPDSADTSVNDDTGETGNVVEGAPVIDDVTAGWCDFPQTGDVVAIYIAYTDGEDDVEGGRVLIDVDGEALIGGDNVAGVAINSEGEVFEARILDGGTREGDVYLAVQPPNKADYELKIRLRDSEGNSSDPYTVIADSDLAEQLCTGNSD